MLLPKEKPFLEGLNSYYLNLEKLTEHLQGEIGSGCIHGKAVDREILIYFDEDEIIRSLLQETRKPAQFFPDLAVISEVFMQNSFVVNIHYLDPNAIFFWGHMQPFQRAKSALKSTEIPLPDLIFRLRQKDFSGFIDVQIINKQDSGLLFFHEGDRVGGSYSWGKGGMSKSDEDYNILLSRVQAGEGMFTFGSYIKKTQEKEKQQVGSTQTAARKAPPRVVNPVHSQLRPALEELLFFFIQTLQEKGEQRPVEVLNEYMQSQLDTYPYLDPYMGYFEYTKGIVKFSADAPKERIIRALIVCMWALVRSYRAEDAFRSKLGTMRNKALLESRNIQVDL